MMRKFAQNRKSDSLVSEDQIVRMLRARFSTHSRFLEKGIGDDAAVLSLAGAQEKWIVTTDMLVEGVDFRRGWLTPVELGWRSLAVNLSDLAAMGSRPRCYTVALGVPAGIGRNWIRAFYRGLRSAGTPYNAVLAGGDLSRSPSGVVIAVTAIGESLHRKILYRSGGRSGDLLYVTGVLGSAAAGLALLERGQIRGRTAAERRALAAHRMPVPRCAAGLWLAQCGFVGALMDLSDGLSTDLPRLCDASSVGAEICLSGLPAFREAAAWGCDPGVLALHGAEDFELLFSVRAEKAVRFEAAYPRSLPPASRIGRLTLKRAVVCITAPGESPRPLPPRGFDHFREG